MIAEHKELSQEQKDRITSILAAGNLVLESLMQLPGMTRKKRDAYRKVILGIPNDCTVEEVQQCRALTEEDKAAVRRIEEVKFDLYCGHIKLLEEQVSRYLKMARFFAKNRSVRQLKEDLRSEAMAACLRAAYRFSRPEVQFSTYLTTVVRNHLHEYCQTLSGLRLNDDVVALMTTFSNIWEEAWEKGVSLGFDEIVRIIVENELRDKQVAATEQSIQEALELQRDRFIDLQQAMRQVISLQHPVASKHIDSPDADAILHELQELLEPQELVILRHRMGESDSANDAAFRAIPKHRRMKAFQNARKVLAKRYA